MAGLMPWSPANSFNLDNSNGKIGAEWVLVMAASIVFFGCRDESGI
jgi:hypothetical protein